MHLDRDFSRRLSTGGEVSFQLLHINDVHNRVEAIQSSGQNCNDADEVRTSAAPMKRFNTNTCMC